MPDEFLFDVDLSDEGRFDDMVRELAASILTHCGCPAATVDETVGSVRAELLRGGAAGLRRFRLQFRKHATELEILVSYAGGPEWRIVRPLP